MLDYTMFDQTNKATRIAREETMRKELISSENEVEILKNEIKRMKRKQKFVSCFLTACIVMIIISFTFIYLAYGETPVDYFREVVPWALSR